MKKIFHNSPKNPETHIWRYIDLPRFLSLLKTRSLHFSRSDLLGDNFEGSFPLINLLRRESSYMSLFPNYDQGKFINVQKQLALSQTNLHKLMLPRIFINCWHVNRYESFAMWELYAQKGKGIAIRTTFRRLKECLPSNINIGLVKYISYSNYSTDVIPEDDPIAPFFYKRKSFEHEKELRAIYFNDMQPEEVKNLNLLESPEEYSSNQKPGHYFPVDLDNLIENIFVYPFIDPWIYEAIIDVSSKYGISTKIIRHSTLEKTPLY